MIEVRIRHCEDAEGIYIGEFNPEEILQLRKAFIMGIKVECFVKQGNKDFDPSPYDEAVYIDSWFCINRDEQFYFEILVK